MAKITANNILSGAINTDKLDTSVALNPVPKLAYANCRFEKPLAVPPPFWANK